MTARNDSCLRADRSAWLTGARSDDVQCWLVCFPHAGAGAAPYVSWARLLPPEIGLRVVQPPGREARLREPALRDARSFAAALAPSIAALADRPVLLFGHSVGAITAFELARELRCAGLPPPAHLYVSGRQAPHIGVAGRETWSLTDDALVAVLRELGGTPATVLDDPELVAMFLPALRADLELNERYQYVRDDPLDAPVTAFAAAEDQRAAPADVAGWALHTARGFTFAPVDGGHFAVTAQPHLVIDRVLADWPGAS
jgi:medium-chain acyl-[acyl-carrier-protein] hydrolase